MRIAVNATAVGDRYNGVATTADNLIESLRTMNHEVFVYSAAKRYADHPGIVFRETPARLGFGGGSMANIKRFGWLQTVFPSWIKADGVHLLITPSIEGLLRPKVPQVVTVHDLIPLCYREENPRLYYQYRYILPRVLASTELVLADSEYTRQNIVKTYEVSPDRIVVAFPGVREELFEPNTNPVEPLVAPPYFLFVGTFSPRKNLKTILAAFAEIAASISERLVVVAYPDKWRDGIVSLAARLNLSSRITYHSGLSTQQLTGLYQHATALVLLSQYEGFGLPPLEAMAVGTPAIVSDSTSLAEVVGDAALKVPCADVNAIASAMQAVSTNPHVRGEMAEQGRRQAARYNRERSAALLHRALAPLLQQAAYV